MSGNCEGMEGIENEINIVPTKEVQEIMEVIDEVEGNDLEGGTRDDGGDLGGGVGDDDDLDTITPKVGMEFSTQNDAYKYYNRYALKMGFGARKSSTSTSRDDPNLVISRRFVCSKQGKKLLKKPTVEGKVHQHRETRVECKAMMKIIRIKSGSWRVSIFVPQHNNHELSTPSKASKHRSHKVHDHIRVERKNNVGKNCAKIVDHFIGKRDIYPSFYSSIQIDDDRTLRSVFWADSRSQESYQKFSDVIVFDVTYRTNNFSLPFAPFTGINHHRQSCLFGCALLADETEETFVWLFQQWLKCMGGKAPGAIITDQDAAIGNAIAVVFPNTLHRYCDWHMDKNIAEHMVHLKAAHEPDFEVYFNRLRTSSSVSEAEDYWKELSARYNLREKSWLPKLWERRTSWIHCYFKDKFLAGMRTSQRAESINSFFDTYVNAFTPLHEFVVQYDKALASRRRAEEDEDFKSLNSKPTLTLEWPLEKHAGQRFTRALFTIFKQEMIDGKSYWAEKVHKVGTITTFSVGRPSTERSKWRIVSYDSDRVIVSCDCKHFESVGLLCRHALAVLWRKHILELPERYILKRWTIESRHRYVDVDMCDNVGDSGVDRDIFWGIRYKFNKSLELAYKTPNLADELDRFLTMKLVEYDKVPIPEGVDVPSQGPNSQDDPLAQPLSQFSFNFGPEITIRDPTAPARTKGRQKHPSRIKYGLEASQEETTKKRTCGFCGEKGHYRTGCTKAKAYDLACGGQSVSGGSQVLPRID